MTKKRFLKLLEEKLIILNEEERNDIINEYIDMIDEKVKHGKTEKNHGHKGQAKSENGHFQKHGPHGA